MDFQDAGMIVSILESIAVLVAAIVAIIGINAWRVEHVGRKRIDTAEEILELFYYLRDAFSDVRSPFGWGGEGRSRKRGDDESPEESEILDRAYVAIERYQAHKDQFAKLRALRYRALAYWGTAGVVPFDTFETISKRILIAARTLPRYWRKLGHGASNEHVERMHKYEADFWSGDDDDELTPLADKMVEQAEQLCRPVIEGQGRDGLWGDLRMNTPNEQQLDRLQRDKEMRANILSEFFARLMWLNAAAIAAIVTFLAQHATLKPSTLLAGRIAATMFATSLAVAIFVPLRRYEASFDRGKRDLVSWAMQLIAASLAAGGVVAVAIAVMSGFETLVSAPPAK
jgi:hypothetical protein